MLEVVQQSSLKLLEGLLGFFLVGFDEFFGLVSELGMVFVCFWRFHFSYKIY